MTKTISIIILLIIMTSCSGKSFDSNKWKNWDGKESFIRWDMADDLINNQELRGKTQREIETLLGKPNNGQNSSADLFYYDLGPCRSGIDYGSLYIKFKDEKVVQVEKHCN